MSAGLEPESFTDRAFFEALVQNGSDAIVTIDRESRIRFANDATERVFGYDPEELVGESLTQVMPDRFHETHQTAVDRYLETGERTLDWGDIELPAEHAEGHEIQVSVTFEEYEYDGETVFSGIMRDISDRKERERKLERQNEQLERFASVVSHDLRSPLQTAKAALAVAKASDDEDALDELDELLDRMDGLVDDVLALATQGQAVDDPEEVSLERVAEEAWRVAGGDQTFETADIGLMADPERLRTLLENLFRNVEDHADADTVQVGTLPDGFFVEDDGRGLSDVDTDRLFEHGYTTAEDGTGIGLDIVETVATAHGWRPEATGSEAGGARFEFHEVVTR